MIKKRFLLQLLCWVKFKKALALPGIGQKMPDVQCMELQYPISRDHLLFPIAGGFFSMFSSSCINI
jgi:hypothetical protein